MVVDRARRPDTQRPTEEPQPEVDRRPHAIRWPRYGRASRPHRRTQHARTDRAEPRDRGSRRSVARFGPTSLHSARDHRRDSREHPTPEAQRRAPHRERQHDQTADNRRAIAREFLVAIARKILVFAQLEQLLWGNAIAGHDATVRAHRIDEWSER